MKQIILEVLSYRREKINGVLWDKYNLKIKIGKYITTTMGARPTVVPKLEVGDIIENMSVIGRIDGEELAREIYEAREITERIQKESKMRASVTEKEKLITKSVINITPQPKKVIEQLSLF